MQATVASPKLLAEQLLGVWLHVIGASSQPLFALLDELDLGLTQVKTLHALEGCAIDLSVKELGERLGMSLPGASRTVESLLQRQLLERREDDVDRRIKRLRITAAGRDVLRRVNTARLENLEAWAATIPDAQREELSRALAPILANLATEAT